MIARIEYFMRMDWAVFWCRVWGLFDLLNIPAPMWVVAQCGFTYMWPFSEIKNTTWWRWSRRNENNEEREQAITRLNELRESSDGYE